MRTWTCDWGQFEIPPDVPIRFTKSGWFDNRCKITPQLRAYFASVSEGLRDGKPVPTWSEWQKQ